MKYINGKLEAINTKIPLDNFVGRSTNNKSVNTLRGKFYNFSSNYKILDGLFETLLSLYL